MEWTVNKCMSLTSQKVRCNKRPMKGNDFCQSHNKQHKYCNESINEIKHNIETTNVSKTLNTIETTYINSVLDKFDKNIEKMEKYLDEKFPHCLLGINQSWKEIPFVYWINIDDMWWDIRSLVKIFSQQLNQSELEKPFPIFIENPFTRTKIKLNDIRNLERHVSRLLKSNCDINIHIAVKKFIDMSDRQLNNILNSDSQYTESSKIINIFNKDMRFRMINYKDSQGRYCGYWVDDTTPLSAFEECYNEIITSSIIFNNEIFRINTFNPHFNTHFYERIIRKFNNLKQEEYDI